jgi:Periplasmic component of the Tol biopolymer transport system
MSRRFLPLLLALPLISPAAKRPVTLDDVVSARDPRSGNAIVWAPDGKRFAYRERNSIWQYDVPSGLKKEVVSLVPLREKAVKAPAAEAFDWQNRRVSESGDQWSSSGAEMLVEAGGDLFLVQVATGEWKQLTATAEAERDPKLSPDGRQVAFRRHRISTHWTSRREKRRGSPATAHRHCSTDNSTGSIRKSYR